MCEVCNEYIKLSFDNDSVSLKFDFRDKFLVEIRNVKNWLYLMLSILIFIVFVYLLCMMIFYNFLKLRLIWEYLIWDIKM